MKPKKLTREEWKELELKELEQEEKIEKECEKLAITKDPKERLRDVKRIFK